MTTDFREVPEAELEELSYSEEYAEFIMSNCDGDRIICNGDGLLAAMEDLYLWEEFLENKGLTPCFN